MALLKAPPNTADKIRTPVTGAELEVVDGQVEVENAEDAKVMVENLGFTEAK